MAYSVLRISRCVLRVAIWLSESFALEGKPPLRTMARDGLRMMRGWDTWRPENREGVTPPTTGLVYRSSGFPVSRSIDEASGFVCIIREQARGGKWIIMGQTYSAQGCGWVGGV